VKPRIRRDECESLVLSLDDEQPIKGIAVMERKARDREPMGSGQPEDAHTGA
jgi:hypothetical protein